MGSRLKADDLDDPPRLRHAPIDQTSQLSPILEIQVTRRVPHPCGVGLCLPAAGIRWPLHRHRKDPAAAKADKPEKGKKAKHHREKSRDKAREKAAREEAGVSPGPRSVGWRYPQPGPAGAGAH